MSERKRKRIIRRKARPRVLVALRRPVMFIDTIVDVARSWDWDLLDYQLACNALPEDLPLNGAIVDLLPDDPLVVRLRERKCPIVRLGLRSHPLDHLLPAVLPDLHASGQLAATHFLERGFEHAAFVGWFPNCESSVYHHLFVSFKKAFEHGGGYVHGYSMVDYHQPHETPEERFVRLQQELGAWLVQLPKPIGIMANSDLILAKLCVIFRSLGGYVPEEVALLGYGNTTWCHRAPVSLSSISPGYQERARRGMDLLRSLMDGEDSPAAPIFVPPAGLVKRRSTDILAMSDILVAQALVFIWEHIQENLTVADVAHAVGLSERQIGRRFQQAIGRSVNQEIVRKRIEEVKRLLRTTRSSITEIARLTGYRSARYLHYAFQKDVGMTPGEFRART